MLLALKGACEGVFRRHQSVTPNLVKFKGTDVSSANSKIQEKHYINIRKH